MKKIDNILQDQLIDIKNQGLYKQERIIETAQETEIDVLGKKVNEQTIKNQIIINFYNDGSSEKKFKSSF